MKLCIRQVQIILLRILIYISRLVSCHGVILYKKQEECKERRVRRDCFLPVFFLSVIKADWEAMKSDLLVSGNGLSGYQN